MEKPKDQTVLPVCAVLCGDHSLGGKKQVIQANCVDDALGFLSEC